MSANEWCMIIGMAAVTFGIRYLLFGIADRFKMPTLMKTSLQYIPPAVLAAIIFPAILLPKGEWFVSHTNPYLIAGLITTLAGVLTKNLLLTITICLITFFGYQWVL